MIIETGEKLQDELRAAGVTVHPAQLARILDVLRAHDSTKRNVPASVTRTQLRVELASRTVPDGCNAVLGSMAAAGENLLATIDTIIGAGDLVAQEYWKASTMERNSPLVGSFGALFNYDDAALDALWIAAKDR